MSLVAAVQELGWPSAEEILSPRPEGARVLAEAMQAKFARGMARARANVSVRVGMLVPDEAGESTPAPIALVCEFPRVPTSQELAIAHRIAWNYSKAPLLITTDPTSIRGWTCCEIPVEDYSRFDA